MESATYPTIQHSSGINVFLPLPTSACCVWWDSRRGKPVLLERRRHDWVCCFQLHGYLYLVKASEDAKRSKQAVKGSAVRNTSKVQWCSMSSSLLCKRLRDSVELKLVEACNILRHLAAMSLSTSFFYVRISELDLKWCCHWHSWVCLTLAPQWLNKDRRIIIGICTFFPFLHPDLEICNFWKNRKQPILAT